MARKKAGGGKVAIVLDEDDDDLEPTGIKGGEVERYEVKIEPPIVSGRKAKAVRSISMKSYGSSTMQLLWLMIPWTP